MGSVVEVTGLEPTTSWSLTKRATKLRYTSICNIAICNFACIKCRSHRCGFLLRGVGGRVAQNRSISYYREISESVK